MLLSAEELEYAKQSSQAVPGANRRSGVPEAEVQSIASLPPTDMYK